MVFKKRKVKHKFCPICGTQLELSDTYCTTCGYSFEARNKKSKKGIKWRNVIIFILILIALYVGLQIFTNQPIIPEFLSNALNLTNSTK